MYFIERYQKDEKEDLEHYRKLVDEKLTKAKESADQNNGDAMFLLAAHYINDRNEDYDPIEGYRYFQRLYAMGQKDMVYILAWLNYFGIGTEQNTYRAVEYFDICRTDYQNAFYGPSYFSLAYLYFFDEKVKDITRGIDYLKKYVIQAIDGIINDPEDVPFDEFGDENEFRMVFESQKKVKDYAKYLKDALAKMDMNLLVDLSMLEEKDFVNLDITNFFLSYCYLTGKGKELNLEKGLETYKKVVKHNLLTQKLELIKGDLPAFIKDYPAGAMDQEFNPYGYIFTQEEVLEYKLANESKAEYHIPSAVMFLAYGYYGKFKYFPKDISKSIQYFKEGLRLNRPEAALALGRIYHDGLDDGIIDLERSHDYFKKALEEGVSDAAFFLAKYAIEDDKNYQKATDILLDYTKKEQEKDAQVLKMSSPQFMQEKNEEKKKEINNYISSVKSGLDLVNDGLKAYEDKDYEKAVKNFDHGAKEGGMTQAAAMMALMYLKGLGVEQSEKTALEIIDELIYTEVF